MVMRSTLRVLAAAILAVFVSLLVRAAGGADPGRAVALPPAIASNAPEFRTDFSHRVVSLGQFATGAFKDAIAAIDRPRFRPGREVAYLQPGEAVVEFVVGGDARAYPVQVLIWHEVVNDRVGGVPVVVTYCPLCNTARAFDRRVRGRELTFGVSGKLRNANLVMFDRETESWWQQFGGTALVGQYAGARLRRLPTRIVSWREFLQAHPDGLVLLRPRARDPRYGINPYPYYDAPSSRPTFLYANAGDRRLPPKERVVLIERRGDAVAVPLSVLRRKEAVRVRVGGRAVVIRRVGWTASPLHEVGIARGRRLPVVGVVGNGRPVPFDTPFWFSVAAFRPNVRLVR